MEMNVRKDLGMAELWLTNRDRKDPSVQVELKSLCRELNARKLKPVVFYSGGDNLEELTSSLLCGNRLRKEQRAVAAERKSGKGKGR